MTTNIADIYRAGCKEAKDPAMCGLFLDNEKFHVSEHQ